MAVGEPMLDRAAERAGRRQVGVVPVVVVIVELEYILPASGREPAKLAGVVIALERVLAKALPLSPDCLGKSGRRMGGGNERQEVHDRSRTYWKVIWAAVPVLDGPAPATDREANVPNKLAVRKAPPASTKTRP